jgi:hypothetical protein
VVLVAERERQDAGEDEDDGEDVCDDDLDHHDHQPGDEEVALKIILQFFCRPSSPNQLGPGRACKMRLSPKSRPMRAWAFGLCSKSPGPTRS